ncbi:MAG: hypothetical protein VYE76_05565, partial [Pseudomonadota bacterium]|nr:hypothetical protein [Pseudomonadota bacterium]
MTRPLFHVSRLAFPDSMSVSRWVVIPMVAALAACSDNDSSSSVTTINLDVQVGQEDFNEAMLRRVTVDETGMPSEVQPGVLSFARFTTDDEGQAVVSADGTEIVYLDVYGRENVDGTSTTRRCQLVDGCGSVAFGAQYTIVGAPGWRSVAVGIEDGQRIRITPLTDLAAQLAFDRVYSQDSGTQQDAGWLDTGFYSVYSTLQAESQVSRLFGIDSIQSREPADLTQIEEWRGANQTEAQYSIRYGALLAAWQSYELSYTSTTDLPSFASAVAADLVANDGQLMQRGGAQTLALYDLYDAAISNLNDLNVTNSTVSGYVASVVAQLQTERDAFVDGDLTSVIPASLSSLLGDELEDYQLGLQRTKAFVQELRDYGNSFFEDGYREQLDSYADLLRGVGEDNAENLDEITTAVSEIAGFYRDCYLNSGCPSVSPEWEWYQSHTYSAPVLTLNGGDFEVSQAVADINLLDEDDAPTSSRAIDILMTGTLVANGLRLELDHTYSDDEISSPSGLRIFYENTVTVLQDEVSAPALAYQIRWTDFTLYDAGDVGSANETELTGAFSILYQGVDDPDGVSGRRFNISEVVLNSRISDVYEDDNGTDS